jgi:hypothetical protein
MSREIVMAIAAVVILGSAIGIAVAYPSHAYRTAGTSGELATVHVYCEEVGAFMGVSAPLQIERRWPQRISTLGAGLVVALGLLTAARAMRARRTRRAAF